MFFSRFCCYWLCYKSVQNVSYMSYFFTLVLSCLPIITLQCNSSFHQVIYQNFKIKSLALEITASLKQNIRFIHAGKDYYNLISINYVSLAQNKTKHSPVTSVQSWNTGFRILKSPVRLK